jgi:hypothetical protein
MKSRIVLSALILSGLLVSCGSSDSGTHGPTVVQEGRLVTITGFTSEILGNNRPIYVYLPADYENSGISYPAIYMHDGQNLFPPGGPYGCWNLDTTLASLEASDSINDVIIIGIGNTAYRTIEYNYGSFTDVTGYARTGIVEDYAQFIITELMPYIQSNYRVLSGPANTSVMGASYGGMASIYMAWMHPDVFGRAGCFSNTLGQPAGTGVWSDSPLMALIRSHTGTIPAVKFWLFAGDAEKDTEYDPDGNGVSAYAEWNCDLASVLTDKGYVYGQDLLLEIGQGGEHNEATWEDYSPAALRFLFGTDADMSVTGISARVSKSTIGTNSTVYLFIKATYANGMQADIPAGECAISSAQSALYTLRDDGRITAGASSGTVTLNISYEGKTTTATFSIN